MDEPRRLLDGSGTELERGLLRELRSYRSTDEMRKRTLAAVAVTGSAGLSLAGLLAWAKTSSAKVLLGVSVVSAVVVPITYFWARPGAVAPSPPTMTRRPAVPTSVVAPPSAQNAEAIAASSPTASSRSSGRASKRGASMITPARPPLRDEIDALDAVRASLARGDFPASLSLLDRYVKAFRHGHLRLEAEILRIDALAGAGKREAARAAAQDFLRRNPRSVHAARLQSLLQD